MQNFLDRFKPPNKNGSGNSNNNNNPLANLFGGLGGGDKSFSGQGQSLGGNTQPGQVIPIVLTEAGPLGIQLEKRSDRQTAIVGSIVAGSQAEAAGLQRGDVLCFAGSQGREEILYEMFLQLAQSVQRPLCLEVRRIAPVKSQPSHSKNADDFARRQAVIAAAELREQQHKKKQKPMAKTSSTDTSKLLRSSEEKTRWEQEQKARQELQQQQPLSAATLEAQALAKASEAKTAAEFGYNPYESKRLSAGQARNAVVTSTHGSIAETGSNGTTTTATSSSSVGVATAAAPGRVAAPRDPVPAADIPDSVQLAFETMVTANTGGNDHNKAVVDSLKILKTLLANATGKGQQPGQDKFRTVRLENTKIKAAVSNIIGAMDVLLECGFQLTQDVATTESILVYPVQSVVPTWIVPFLQLLEQYIENSSSHAIEIQNSSVTQVLEL